MVNTSLSLTADLVSETRKREFIQDSGEVSFRDLSPGKPCCETLSGSGVEVLERKAGAWDPAVTDLLGDLD